MTTFTCGAPLTALACAVAAEPRAVFPPPTWAVPTEPGAVFPPEPETLTGDVTETGPTGVVAVTAGALPVDPICAVPTEPSATLPPSAHPGAGPMTNADAAAAAATTRNRRFMRRPPPPEPATPAARARLTCGRVTPPVAARLRPLGKAFPHGCDGAARGAAPRGRASSTEAEVRLPRTVRAAWSSSRDRPTTTR